MTETARYPSMATHPDLVEMQARYERASASSPAGITEGLVLLAGVWLAISPWVIGFNNAEPRVTVSNLIVGIGVAVVALGLTALPARMVRVSWATAAMGAWAAVSQWVILRWSAPTGMWVNNLITGGIIFLLGLGAVAILLAGSRRSTRRASGGRFDPGDTRGEGRHFESGAPRSEGRRYESGEPRTEARRYDSGDY
jgi:SPW repeat